MRRSVWNVCCSFVVQTDFLVLSFSMDPLRWFHFLLKATAAVQRVWKDSKWWKKYSDAFLELKCQYHKIKVLNYKSNTCFQNKANEGKDLLCKYTSKPDIKVTCRWHLWILNCRTAYIIDLLSTPITHKQQFNVSGEDGAHLKYFIYCCVVYL